MPRDTGWNSIEGMPFKVSSVAAGGHAGGQRHHERGRRHQDRHRGQAIGRPSWSCAAPNFTANNPAGATIDVTTLCDIAHRIVAGLPAIGTWNAAGFYDCGDIALFRARDYYRSGEDCIIDVRLADGCGWTFAAIVNTFDVTLGINAAVANTMGGQIDGQIHFYKTPAAGSPRAWRGSRHRRIAARPATAAAGGRMSDRDIWNDRPVVFAEFSITDGKAVNEAFVPRRRGRLASCCSCCRCAMPTRAKPVFGSIDEVLAQPFRLRPQLAAPVDQGGLRQRLAGQRSRQPTGPGAMGTTPRRRPALPTNARARIPASTRSGAAQDRR